MCGSMMVCACLAFMNVAMFSRLGNVGIDEGRYKVVVVVVCSRLRAAAPV